MHRRPRRNRFRNHNPLLGPRDRNPMQVRHILPLGGSDLRGENNVFTKSLVNPYEPTHAEIEKRKLTFNDEAIFVPYRLDWLVWAAIGASLLDSISICIFQSKGTGAIGDLILAPLAAHSLAWIPIYRLAVPLLIPMMPNVCRQSFAVFYLSVGVVFCVNNLSGHYLGTFVFVDSVGLYPTLAICFVLGFLTFCVQSARSGSLARSIRIAVTWLALAVIIQGIFFAVGRSI